jgi:transposase
LSFSDTFGATSVALFTEFDIEEIADLSIQELIDFLIEKGKNRFSDPEGYAKEIKRLARNCYNVDREIEDAVNLTLETSLETIKSLKSSLKRINKAIKREIAKFKQTLDSVPGIGAVFTAGIIAEIGDISNYSHNNKIAKYAGLTWNHKQSNDFESDETRMSKYGNKYLRHYLIQAANSVKSYCQEYKDYYQKKYRESTKHKHKRALVLTARKLVRLIFVLLRDNRLYDPSRYLKTKGGGSHN